MNMIILKKLFKKGFMYKVCLKSFKSVTLVSMYTSLGAAHLNVMEDMIFDHGMETTNST